MKKSNYQRGFYMIEAIVMMSVAVSLMTIGARYISRDTERTVNQITAKHLQQVTEAAQQYVQDHYKIFESSGYKTIFLDDLIKKGYLPDTTSRKNHYGQTYCVRVKKNQVKENTLLQVIITTEGGNPINEQSMRQIADLAGSSAGYVSTLNEGKITGNQQSWFVEDNNVSEVGHLASLKIVSGKEVVDAATFLRRKKIDNHPEYNQMETDLEFIGDIKTSITTIKPSEIYLTDNEKQKNMKISSDQILITSINEKSVSKINGSMIELNSDTSSARLDSNSIKIISNGEVSNINSKNLNINEINTNILKTKKAYIDTMSLDMLNLSKVPTEGITHGAIAQSQRGNSSFSELSLNFIKFPVFGIRYEGRDEMDAAAGLQAEGICQPSGSSDGRVFITHNPYRPRWAIFICLGGGAYHLHTKGPYDG